MMRESLHRETADLKFAWASKTPEKLRSYLVSGIQDPRSNMQSILTRHHLIRRLFGSRFEPLQRQELAHAMRLNSDRVDQRTTSDELKTEFQRRWQAALAHAEAASISVLEAACGSANDYRFLHAYGVARFLQYSGFDLSDANIANARDMFPDVDFRVGNVFDIPRRDDSVDCVVAFDLFEHLSLEGLEAAIDEVCRVARRGLVLNFFNIEDVSEHVPNPVAERRYHWNTLSLKKITALLAARSRAMEIVHVHGMLCEAFRSHGAYDSFLDDLNPNLFTFFIEK
jgi:ubiquinone/menaquinone biosynthesis C-methylase UbiE